MESLHIASLRRACIICLETDLTRSLALSTCARALKSICCREIYLDLTAAKKNEEREKRGKNEDTEDLSFSPPRAVRQLLF